MLSREDVIAAYALILQRSPESEDAIACHRNFSDLPALGRHMVSSPEFLGMRPVATLPHPHQLYTGYKAADLAILQAFTAFDGPGIAGFVINFIGARTRCSLQSPLLPFDGQVESLPVPVGSTLGETAEWIGTLRSVIEAGDRLRVLELGAGFGPWMATTHLAATRRGISDIHVYGVDADIDHVGFIHTNMRDNDIPESEYSVFHGAVGAKNGVVHWAVDPDPAGNYGGRPVEPNGSTYLGTKFESVVEVPVIAIDGLLAREPRWDLVHIDIQGHEGEVCQAGIGEMTQRVHRVVVGTHSRVQDGIVMDVFHRAGWTLENEKPTITAWNDAVPTVEGMAVVDGVQVWRNPAV